MDVRMPDGTIVSNVPDDISQAELLARYNKFSQPATPTGVSDSSSDLIRGFKSYLPQTQETFGGFKTLLGKAVGSEGLFERGAAILRSRGVEHGDLHHCDGGVFLLPEAREPHGGTPGRPDAARVRSRPRRARPIRRRFPR